MCMYEHACECISNKLIILWACISGSMCRSKWSTYKHVNEKERHDELRVCSDCSVSWESWGIIGTVDSINIYGDEEDSMYGLWRENDQ